MGGKKKWEYIHIANTAEEIFTAQIEQNTAHPDAG